MSDKPSPASKLFHILYPSTNFYSIDSVRRQKFEQGAREFEQYLKEQKKEQGQ